MHAVHSRADEGRDVKVRLGIVAGAALLSSGCALFNPYVYPKDANGRYKHPPMSKVEFAGGMNEAISYADIWRKTYVDAAAVHSTTRNVSAAVVLPLTATSLFYGITDHGSADRITRMALGGAMIYGGNEFLTSRPRQRLYLAGAKAMTCAIVQSRPYLVTGKWLEEFDRRRQTFTVALAGLEEARTRLTSKIVIAEGVAKTDALNSLISSSRRVEAAAKVSAGDAVQLQQKAGVLSMRIMQSGQELLGVVRAINDRVNEEMQKTEPDMQTLKGILSGTEGLAADLAGSAWPKPPAEEASTPAGGDTLPHGTREAGGDSRAEKAHRDLSAARDQVVESQSALASIGLALLADVQAVSQLGEVSKVADCVPPEVSIPLSVSPSGETFDLKVGDAFVVKADGGIGWLSYQLTGPKTDALNVSVISQRTSHLVLMIKASEKLAEGYGPTLTISDEAGNARKSFTVKAE